ncbi:MAG: hypothetical protein OEW05_14325 [Candidatus Aminicenantes bacterium]|nr:hypothetical protein [Candidatus Aminicenantes bacterium]
MNARARILALVIIASASVIGWPSVQTEAKTDVWAPFRFFVGNWDGRGEGQGGVSSGVQEFRFILGGRYLHVTNETRFAPQEKNPKGEVHQDWGVFSFDGMRKKYVFRQFHVEGFVNQYVCDGPEPDGKTFIFISEAIENIPPDFRARLTYKILNENEFQQTFDLAQGGQEFTCYSQGIMKRRGAAK